MSEKIIRNGFIVAGLSNVIGVLVFSKAFTNQTMMGAQPGVMGAFGLAAIILWGFAYIAVAKNYAKVPWLVAVFALEKLAYVAAWVAFHSSSSIKAIYGEDTLAGIFYAAYGPSDFLFMLFFAYVFFTSVRARGG